MNASLLFFGLVFGCIGFGFFLYGRISAHRYRWYAAFCS
jgi:hypothetical protein